MDRQTKERIQYYKEYLPRVKEKIIGAAMMFLLAAVMVASATFAWITLSSSPEVTSIETTVTANGNLEIALSKPDGSAPDQSASGDSTAAGNPRTKANLTWGNVINLADPAYGLSKVTLRPAALHGTTGLLSNPLYGVSYGEDGRVQKMTTSDDFAYVYRDESGALVADFDNKHLGVRAISTVEYEMDDDAVNNTFAEYNRVINERLNTANANYRNMVDETKTPGAEYIKSIEGLMTVYTQLLLDYESPDLTTLDVTAYIPDLYEMMTYFYDSVMIPTGEAYFHMANMTALIETGVMEFDWANADELCLMAKNNRLPGYISSNMPSLRQYALDRIDLKDKYLLNTDGMTDAQKKSSLAYWNEHVKNGGKVYWTDVSAIINWIVNINTCTVDDYTIGQIAGSGRIALNVFNNSTHTAVLKDGALKRNEQLTGAKMASKVAITLDPKMFLERKGYGFMNPGVQNLSATVMTNATDDATFRQDFNTVLELLESKDISIKSDKATAKDTYAMAIDFWLRTNAGSDEDKIIETSTSGAARVDKTGELAFLTLEGNLRTKTVTQDVYTNDINGNPCPKYSAEYTIGTEKFTLDCYQRDGKYYYISSEGQEIDVAQFAAESEDTIKITAYTKVVEEVTQILGYDGENRVWTDGQLIEYDIDGTSTTQGNGSCYVFYADTPADQSRFLELLTAMKVVFINDEGRQIGFANMDTENFYAENGKVTVPLVLDGASATNLGADGAGKTHFGLTVLPKNTATRITALVYLDGTKLSNDMVLASGDIQGTLNIQFSTKNAIRVTTTTSSDEGDTVSVSYEFTNDSLAIKDSALMDDYISVSASADPVSFNLLTDKNPATNLTVTVEGAVSPNLVQARFIRAISSTQGVMQELVTLSGSGNTWTASVPFKNPGTYILRSVFVNGVEYSLSQPVTVTVDGYKLNSIVCDAIKDGRNLSVLTAENAYSTEITFDFAAYDSPDKVTGIFVDEKGGQVNVELRSSDKQIWTGKADFRSSGKYTLKYYEVAGEVYEIDEGFQLTFDLLLGLKVHTFITCSPETLAALKRVDPNATATSFVFSDELTGVTLNVAAQIFDNNGGEIGARYGVKLEYGKSGSSVEKLDANLTWNAATRRYEGDFLVQNRDLGAFKFSTLTVENNKILTAVSAPEIRVMPPDDVSYYDNKTNSAINVLKGGEENEKRFTLGLAYSSAASRIEALISDGGPSPITVAGRNIGKDVAADVSVTNWAFDIPYDGNWTLENITLYGVYYGGQMYGDDNGVTIDLAAENIKTRVIDKLYITLEGESKDFTGDFMTTHTVAPMTMTVVDFEGAAISDLGLSDLQAVYTLNTSEINADTYGYTAQFGSTVSVTATGSKRGGSETVYDIASAALEYAGPYTTSVSFNVYGRRLSLDSQNVSIVFKEGGVPVPAAPRYTVKWNTPDVVFTATSGSGNLNANFDVNFATGNGTGVGSIKSGQNHVWATCSAWPPAANTTGYLESNIEGYDLLCYFKVTQSGCTSKKISGYTATTASAKLTGIGNKNISATLDFGPNPDVKFTFTGNQTVSTAIGSASGVNRSLVGNREADTLQVTYNGMTFNLKLKHKLRISNPY